MIAGQVVVSMTREVPPPMQNSYPDPSWAATAAGEHASPLVTERVYEPSIASCVAMIWHQLVVQFRLIDGVAVMNKLRRCLKPRLPAWWLALAPDL